MGKLKHGLYYKEESFETYYDKIAVNYKNNLPLIFGKWYLLKRILKIFAAYNFDIVLDKETRDNAMKSLSVISDILYPNQPQQVSITSGNKEIYEAAKSIEGISYRQLGEIQVKGMEESLNFVESLIHNFLPDKPIQEARSIIRQKTKAVFQLIDEITTLLDPLAFDPKSFIENIGKGQEFVDVERLSRLYDIDTVEKPFANQISFQYYLNLNNEDHFEVMYPMNYYVSMMKSNYGGNSQKEEQDEYSLKAGLLPLSPRMKLLSILQRDDDIKMWFSSWIENLESYQNDILTKIRNFHKKIEEL
jgi:hypothetical protein